MEALCSKAMVFLSSLGRLSFLSKQEVHIMENHEPTAMIYAPRTAGQYDRLKATDNQPLVRPASMQEIPHLQIR